VHPQPSRPLRLLPKLLECHQFPLKRELATETIWVGFGRRLNPLTDARLKTSIRTTALGQSGKRRPSDAIGQCRKYGPFCRKRGLDDRSCPVKRGGSRCERSLKAWNHWSV